MTMDDDQPMGADHPPVEREPLTDEQLAELELEYVMNTPMQLPIRFKVTECTLPGERGADGEPAEYDKPGVVATIQTPIGVQRYVFTRDEALTFASGIRKAANRGGGDLVVAEHKLHIPGAGT